MSIRYLILFAGLVCMISLSGEVRPAMAQEDQAQSSPQIGPKIGPEIGPETGLPMPRFVSLNPKGADAVNVRTGPSVQYPIKWIYRRPHLPVQIIAEYGLWRRIKDMDNDEGWVHKSLLSGRRTGLVIERIRVLYRKPQEDAVPAFLAQPGVIGRLQHCDVKWCKLRVDEQSGWIKKSHLWGAFEDETWED